jgi:hypothetical protein
VIQQRMVRIPSLYHAAATTPLLIDVTFSTPTGVYTN